jgi:DNA-binding FadR family transcriptional regulator
VGSGNRRMIEDFRHLWDEIERVIHHTGLLRTHAAALRHDHDALVAALATGRGDDAAAAVDDENETLHRMIVDTALKTASMLVPAAGAAPVHQDERRTGLS